MNKEELEAAKAFNPKSYKSKVLIRELAMKAYRNSFPLDYQGEELSGIELSVCQKELMCKQLKYLIKTKN